MPFVCGVISHLDVVGHR